ncbi:MAG TPA: permease prefix domain 1-containing protein [Marmoricola sp.]|nr:permease prefix domain 1-containing protein [Marmoricola sp.]
MTDSPLEAQIDEWRSYVHGHREVSAADGDELEDHLRARIDELTRAGLAPDEAFLVAVKRVGRLDELTREFAREHSGRLWKQLVLGSEPASVAGPRSLVIALGWAVAAAVLFKLPALFGASLEDGRFYLDNAALLALAPLAGYVAVSRAASRRTIAVVVGLFALAVVGANVYPTGTRSDVVLLTFLHVPIALWIAIGFAYTDGDWRAGPAWMDFIRFTGEWIIYMVLIALGGGVLAALTGGALNATGIDPETFVFQWMLPCGAAGAAVVAAWLVEEKKSVIENMAPVLGRLFTPLFVATLFGLIVAILANGVDVDRDALILFDLVLVVVLGLIVYSFSARDVSTDPSLFDRLQLGLVVLALVADVLVLVALGRRLSDFGFSANRTAALGENLVLLGNLAWSAWLLYGFDRGKVRFALLESWQTRYVWVYAGWAWLVVFLFPPVFGFHTGSNGIG